MHLPVHGDGDEERPETRPHLAPEIHSESPCNHHHDAFLLRASARPRPEPCPRAPLPARCSRSVSGCSCPGCEPHPKAQRDHIARASGPAPTGSCVKPSARINSLPSPDQCDERELIALQAGIRIAVNDNEDAARVGCRKREHTARQVALGGHVGANRRATSFSGAQHPKSP